MTPDTPVPVARPENEAAERLRERFHVNAWDTIAEQFEDALATERRLTVERIRERIEAEAIYKYDTPDDVDPVLRILDEEANR